MNLFVFMSGHYKAMNHVTTSFNRIVADKSFKAMNHVTTSFNRIVADKSHLVTLLLQLSCRRVVSNANGIFKLTTYRQIRIILYHADNYTVAAAILGNIQVPYREIKREE